MPAIITRIDANGCFRVLWRNQCVARSAPGEPPIKARPSRVDSGILHCRRIAARLSCQNRKIVQQLRMTRAINPIKISAKSGMLSALIPCARFTTRTKSIHNVVLPALLLAEHRTNQDRSPSSALPCGHSDPSRYGCIVGSRCR